MKIWLKISMMSALVVVAFGNLHNPLGIKIMRNTATCEKSGSYCASDCSTLMVCAALNAPPMKKITCLSPNQYCVGNTCTNVAGPSCTNAAVGSFLCTADGTFPDPDDCRRSHFCVGGISTPYECPAGFVFNSKLNSCQVGRTPCTRIDCSRATAANPYVVYASNPAYYALCVNNGNGNMETIMFKCENEQSEFFDSSIKSCRFRCSARGYFQNPNNCAEYFYCSGASTSTRPIVLECPKDFVFDGTRCNSDPKTCKFTTTTTTTTIENTTIENTTIENTTIENTTIENTTIENTTIEETTIDTATTII